MTVGVFYSIGKAYVARAFLESRGIHCFIKEEIGQNYHYAKLHFYEITELQVGQNDVLKARNLLLDNDFVQEKDEGPSQVMLVLDRFTATIPLIGALPFEIRVSLVFILLLILLAGISALVFQNTVLG